MTPLLRSLSSRLLALAFLAPVLTAQSGVSGQVFDANTLQPLQGVKVTWQATTETTISDQNGLFSLPAAQGTNIVIVGALREFYYGSVTTTTPATGVTLYLEPVAHGNDPNYSFMEPMMCATCHPDQYEQWNGSPMAKAGSNTWVYDIYDGTGTAGGMGGFVYTRDSIHAGSHPNSECASCHQPEPWVENFGKPLDRLSNLSNGSLHGISCEVCHKISDVDETKTNYPGIWPGIVTIDRPASPLVQHQVTYGVLGDVSYESPMMMRPSYNPELVAETCAACHQDKNDPDGDYDFEEANGVISEPTYLEWKASPYSDPSSPMYASCVDCHMPAFGAIHAGDADGYDEPVRDPSTIRSHNILGTTPEYLENAVELFVDSTRDATGVDVTVEVLNSLTGHTVPTGVTVRNMVLLVEAVRVSDGQTLAHLGNQTIHALGGFGNPAQGYYAGLPGKLYAKHNEDANGNGPTFYTDAAAIRWDTRIPALASDVTNYRFDAPAGTGEVEIRTRLIYRRCFRFLVDAKQWTTDGHGNPLEDVQAPHYGHLMEEVWTHSQESGPGTLYCSGATNSTGNTAHMSATGSASVANNDLVLVASGIPDPANGAFFVGDGTTSTPFGNGTLCVNGTVGRFPIIGPSAGSVVSQPVNNQQVPGGFLVQPGTTLNFQYYFRDPLAGGASFNLTDGYQVTFQL
jgi:CarboxypepD_reg-like domain/Cytochrome c554 and c-prime